MVGAGVGGIAGWIKGNKVKEEYQDNVEEMEKQAERAKRVYEVTGLSIDKVHFANDDLNEAMKDTNLTAEELEIISMRIWRKSHRKHLATYAISYRD